MERTERNRAHEASKADMSGLKLLSEMDDFKVAGDSTDIRGWDVIGGDGRKIGKVEHLLVDPGAMTVRYLGVDLDRDLRRGRERPHSDHGDHVLIPVDRARIGDDHQHNVYFGRSSTEIGTLPTYDHNSIGSLLHGSARPARGESTGREREARMTLSEEELVMGKRKVAAGEVTIDKKVEHDRVHQSVPVMREEVTVERRPATSASTAPRMNDDEIRIPLMREEVVTEKRVVPREELIVKKHETQGRQEVEETVRKERVEVHGDEHVKNVGRRTP